MAALFYICLSKRRAPTKQKSVNQSTATTARQERQVDATFWEASPQAQARARERASEGDSERASEREKEREKLT